MPKRQLNVLQKLDTDPNDRQIIQAAAQHEMDYVDALETRKLTSTTAG